jgi:2-polyprenyl-6-methoxyphenol hydroxylase-like FAD-dependent oxidoreductase
MLLARAGARVLMVDKGAYGTDMLSTHALMRGAVLQLDRWGVLPEIIAAGTPPIRSTSFYNAESNITIPIEPRYGIDALYAPRRALLDRILVDAAAKSGAEVRFGVRVEDVLTDHRGRVTGILAVERGALRGIETDLVIGADGLYSTVASRVGAGRLAGGRHSTAVLYSYWQGLAEDGYRWWFRPGASMGAIPTNNGATCVFVSVSSASFRDVVRGGGVANAYDGLIRRISPEFAGRMAAASRVEPIRGFEGHQAFIKRAGGPGWALVGDAGYFKDPLTAHGITDALRDAELLARSAIRDTPSAFVEYENTRHELSRRLFDATDEIASLTWTDAQLQTLHRAFSAEMSREVRVLAALEPITRPLASASTFH